MSSHQQILEEEGKSDPKRSWYSQTFSDDEEESPREAGPTSHVAAEVPLTVAACSSSEHDEDHNSDASTDVGDEAQLCLDDDSEDEAALAPHCQASQVLARPSFLKVDQAQRIEQLKRVVDEFCTLDFDAVDASSQEGVAMRRLTLLKSLKEPTVYYSENQRFEQTRLALLGLDNLASTLDQITVQGEQLCESRHFRSAFEALEEAVPHLGGKTMASKQLNDEEVEAMKFRRAQRKQRQRAERREQRSDARAERSAQRWNPAHGRR